MLPESFPPYRLANNLYQIYKYGPPEREPDLSMGHHGERRAAMYVRTIWGESSGGEVGKSIPGSITRRWTTSPRIPRGCAAASSCAAPKTPARVFPSPCRTTWTTCAPMTERRAAGSYQESRAPSPRGLLGAHLRGGIGESLGNLAISSTAAPGVM